MDLNVALKPTSKAMDTAVLIGTLNEDILGGQRSQFPFEILLYSSLPFEGWDRLVAS